MRMTGMQYHPKTTPKTKNWVYRPADERGVVSEAKLGRPPNPNKLSNAEKQKKYREKLKLKKQMCEA
jgi:hypothetical protein